MKNIHKWFGEGVHALKGVDFSIDFPGECVGLVGDNGAGKSTLIKILTGFISPDEGEIYFNGEKVKFKSPKEARKAGIETVYQEQALAEDLSVTRNIFLGEEKTKKIGFLPIPILDEEKMEEESKSLMEDIGLNVSSMEQEARFCSGGERQGIAIARSMYFDADVVILDEPTRALGTTGTRKVLDLVEGLREEDIASIFITHNLHHVYPVADRFVLLERGRKLFEKPKEETSVEELNNHMLKADTDTKTAEPEI